MPDDFLPKDWEGNSVNRPLVDDFANVLASTVSTWPSLPPEVRRVLARYQAVKKEELSDKTGTYWTNQRYDDLAFHEGE